MFVDDVDYKNGKRDLYESIILEIETGAVQESPYITELRIMLEEYEARNIGKYLAGDLKL